MEIKSVNHNLHLVLLSPRASPDAAGLSRSSFQLKLELLVNEADMIGILTAATKMSKKELATLFKVLLK